MCLYNGKHSPVQRYLHTYPCSHVHTYACIHAHTQIYIPYNTINEILFPYFLRKLNIFEYNTYQCMDCWYVFAINKPYTYRKYYQNIDPGYTRLTLDTYSQLMSIILLSMTSYIKSLDFCLKMRYKILLVTMQVI